MSDTDKDHQNDVVTSGEDAPEMLSDEHVSDANGGWSFMSTTTATTHVVMSGGTTMINTDINPNTADHSTSADMVTSEETRFKLRRRPGRI